VHPCDGEAWQHFDVDFLDFVRDKRNARLCVATDGFTPFNINAAPYSCWPVFVTPLNLPPDTLLRSEYIFLSLVIPGPKHPGKKLNILMQPLVDEFQKLWDEGVMTWDASLKCKFRIKAIYLWSVNTLWRMETLLVGPLLAVDFDEFYRQHSFGFILIGPYCYDFH
jgi:hypothetical protein